MDSDKDLKFKIHYYCREKYYQTAENLAVEGSKNYPDDSSFKLYISFCLLLCGRHQESIRELEHLINVKDVNIGATLALITAHKLCQVVDKETVLQLENKLKTERKTATDLGLYYGALFLYFVGKFSKSSEYLEKFLKTNPESLEGLALKGWLELSLGKSFSVSTQCFNTVLEMEKRNLNASLGLIKIKELEGDLMGAMSQLNQLIVKYSNFLPPLIEKMKVQLASNDWDLTVEIANRILTMDGTCLEAFRIKTLVLICRDGNFDETAYSLRRFCSEIQKTEKKNGRLFYENAQLFSYLSGKNPKVLAECYLFAEKAAQLEPSNPDFITELGYQNLRQGNIKEAMKFFKNATKLDESSVSALTGLTLCQIQEGGINEQVKQQVEFLREIQAEQPCPELLLMSAKLAANTSEALNFLNQATKACFDNFKKYPYGISYLYYLNPVFLMEVVSEYLKYAPTNQMDYSVDKKIPEPFEKSLTILEELTTSCPGLVEAQYEYAYVQFLTGNLKKTKQILHHILDDLDATAAEAHILMAQVHLKEKNYKQGAQSLEVGLSYNFKIREHPIYHLNTAMVHKENGNVTESINSLKSAVSAAGLKVDGKVETRQPEFKLSVNDKVMIYLELVDAYLQNNQMSEASKLIESAMSEFKGTSEESRVIITNAQMLVKQGKVTQGIEILQKIQPSDTHYALAKKTLANIFVVNKKDPEMFAECYKDLVENCPNAETYVMLGDAYMSIQEADQAIEAYEKALKTNSKDVKLICKMGKALVKTHHFSKAINYYKEAAKTEGNSELIYDMAELYFKLGQLDNAERTLTTELENSKIDSSDWNQLVSRTKLLQLLAKMGRGGLGESSPLGFFCFSFLLPGFFSMTESLKLLSLSTRPKMSDGLAMLAVFMVRDKSGNLTESLSALKTAKENYNRIDKRVLSQSDEHKEILSQICSDMAVLLTRLRDFSGAIKCYKESLSVKPDDPKILSSICRLYMQVNDLEECQATSKKLLAADPNSEPAVIMLADLAFRKVDFETAAFHYKQVLEKRPTYWTALARLIEVMRRMGSLEEVVPYLDEGEKALLQPLQDPGFSFCKGLFERYSERPSAALHHFNRARRHAEWGSKATHSMIEICLNPENETLRSETLTEELEKEEFQDSKEIALKTAQKLLSELKAHHGNDEGFDHRLLGNFWLLATNQKANVEKALQDFVVMATQDLYKENVAVALGIASAYMLQKQVQKARNQLKRVMKNQWNYEDAEYLERAWLLLTDIYIQSGKMDLPVELIQKILQHNKSCYKAYDYAGLIAEKEQLYKEAALQYENAWKYCGQTNPAIGYKLAFNYLKGKRYADAIDVCYTILKLYPDYPRIQKEILEKAKTNLRT